MWPRLHIIAVINYLALFINCAVDSSIKKGRESHHVFQTLTLNKTMVGVHDVQCEAIVVFLSPKMCF